MGENKGHGMKGRNYDELSGVGTSSAGITGTTGNLNDGVHDGGVGKPAASDSGNRAGNQQSAQPNDGDTTPALGSGTRSSGNRGSSGGGGGRGGQNRQSGSQSGQSQQSGSGSGQDRQGGPGFQGRSLDQDVLGKEN